MPELTFEEKIFEEFDKISFPTETDYGCDGANDNCCGFCGGEYIDEFGTRVIIRDFISQALDRHRKEFVKCLPDEEHDSKNNVNKWFHFFNGYNSCRRVFLENLKKANLI